MLTPPGRLSACGSVRADDAGSPCVETLFVEAAGRVRHIRHHSSSGTEISVALWHPRDGGAVVLADYGLQGIVPYATLTPTGEDGLVWSIHPDFVSSLGGDVDLPRETARRFERVDVSALGGR